MSRRVSIVDVAKLAKTSTATVSRIINDTGYPVAKETRARVLKAIDELNYLPSLSAQKLRQDFSEMIGLITRDVAAEFFAEIAKGATERAMDLGYLSFICNTGREPMKEFKFHELLWRNRVRGIILIGGGYNTDEYRDMINRQLERAAQFGFRMVTNTPQGFDMPSVTIDHRGAFYCLTNYLIEKHHERIALLTSDIQVFTSIEHFAGFESAMLEHNLTVYENLVKFRTFTEQGGYESCNEILRLPDRPTAICCGCDPIALGAIRAINEAGLSIPNDISVVSFGNTSIASHLFPALSCIDVPRYKMGALAVEMILTDMYTQNTNIILPTRLIERESVKDLEE
ncbi:MAG: LacI family DNA-binding transcriptional regulator [Sphaerochaetaceae bacterium]|nr:LacI family transcriptional regulator [Sphaerochaetaceae bacterium]MDD2295685.1 LacI family DNA-binding transcriptional regulator [Eubacteriales bacterium]NLO59595.1 LacI family transcriptional regulator [Spirochaetales bacterium]MDD3671191.1 LacI family DNA-binding transcriptional regulator [Sphaerochaetaceae bacterium]MDD4260026.1 LacI family DNA-binding transcriptional regulator [Sphaerochaetaceae bacterium]